MTLTPAQADAIVNRMNETGEDGATAAAALGIDVSPSMSNFRTTEATKGATDTPWAKNVVQDARIPLERLSDNIERAEGIPQDEALKKAIRMDGMAAAPLIAEEDRRFAERAERAARHAWEQSAEGIEAMGRERQAEAAKQAERAAAMRLELQARGVPIDDSTPDAEVLSIVEGVEAKHAAAREAADPAANLAAATKGSGANE